MHVSWTGRTQIVSGLQVQMLTQTQVVMMCVNDADHGVDKSRCRKMKVLEVKLKQTIMMVIVGTQELNPARYPDLLR